MSAYAGLYPEIAVAASRLDDAISARERIDGCGYTMLLIPMDPGIPILVSLDGKPTTVDPADALALALSS